MYFLAALAVIAAGCAKEAKTPAVEEFEETPEVVIEPSSVVFTAGIDTKAHIEGTAVNWDASDAITVWNGSAAAKFTTTDSGASATFTTAGAFAETGTYTALYPHDGSADFSDPAAVATTLPVSQTAAAGTFDPAANLAVASSTTTSLTFHNLVSYLKFTVPAGMDDLKSVSFSGNAGQKVAGDATVNVGTKALTATGSETATLSGTFTAGSTYYLAIAPQTFTGGYTVTITRTSGTYTMVSSKNVTFSRAIARNIGNLWDGKAKVVLGGSALGGAAASLEQTLENENLYAAVVDLTAGNLTLTQYMQNKVIAPVSGHDFNDGTTTVVAVSAPDADKYITISDAGKYRIIYDAGSNNLTIQSPVTFVANKSVSYINTVDKINDYPQEVTELWMYGGFNGYAHDDGLKTGFQAKYRLTQSAANPYLFVYSGAVLPRNSETFSSWNTANGSDPTDKANPLSVRGCVFLVSNIENNVYAYGASGTNAKRNTRHAKVTPALDDVLTTAAGQSDNRYALFEIPNGANYVEVDIENLTVVFKAK